MAVAAVKSENTQVQTAEESKPTTAGSVIGRISRQRPRSRLEQQLIDRLATMDIETVSGKGSDKRDKPGIVYQLIGLISLRQLRSKLLQQSPTHRHQSKAVQQTTESKQRPQSRPRQQLIDRPAANKIRECKNRLTQWRTRSRPEQQSPNRLTATKTKARR